jgi:DNA-binding response OmpR family regulator
LQQSGYELVIATTGHEGLRLFMERPVDAIVLEYQLALLDGAVVAKEIKQVRPTIPIVMLTDNLELPDGALKSVDALVTKSDGPHFLLATVHLVLSARPAQDHAIKTKPRIPLHLRRAVRSRTETDPSPPDPDHSAADDKEAPFSPGVWRSIRNGTIQF